MKLRYFWIIGAYCTILLALSPALSCAAVNQAKIACGYDLWLAIRTDGTLWGCGKNIDGEMGQENTYPYQYKTPVQITSATNWVAVAGGYAHCLGVRADGTLWAWGANGYGQLGTGNTDDKNIPTRVGNGTNWVAVFASNAQSFGIKSDGSLWAWGWNGYDQLGLNGLASPNIPTRVGNATNWEDIAAGDLYTFGLQSGGTLWAWGSNGFDALGLNITNGFYQQPIPAQVAGGNWMAAAAGSGGCLGLCSNKSLWGWGDNNYGQLGMGYFYSEYVGIPLPTVVPTSSNCTAIAEGGDHSLVIKAGSLYTCGANDYGQLGLGNTTNQNSLHKVGSFTDWVAVAGGDEFSVGLRSDGSLWAWGSNYWGQLGQGNTTDSWRPVQVPGIYIIPPSEPKSAMTANLYELLLLY